MLLTEIDFIFLLIFGSLGIAFFALGASLLSRSRTSKVRELAEEKVSGATRALALLEKAEQRILGCYTGALLIALLLGAQIQEYLTKRASVFSGIVGDQGCGVLCAIAAAIIFLGLALVIFLPTQVIKGATADRREHALCYISLPLSLLCKLFSPVTFLVESSLSLMHRVFGLRVLHERERAISPEDISEMAELGSESGQIEEDELEMIQGVFSFSDTIVREVMTPRKDIIHIREDASLSEVVKLLAQERVSRILVTGEELDEVKGVIIAKDLMRFLGQHAETFDMKKVIRPAFLVPNTKKIDELLQELRHKAIHLAIVLDEHGGVDGVVTVEDLIEEIVGEIFDEHDSPSDETGLRATKSGDLMVQGSQLIDDLNAMFNIEFPAGHYDTIAGFVINLLGRIPHAGDTVEFQGVRIRVEIIEQNRITLLRILGGKKYMKAGTSPQSLGAMEPESKKPELRSVDTKLSIVANE